jgi:glucose/arabinose dehydrogenase
MRPNVRVVVALVTALCVIGTGCTGGDAPEPSATSSAPGSPAGPPTPSTARPSPTPELADVAVRLRKVAALEQPLALAVRPGDPALYVAQKTGLVVAVRGGTVDPEPVLDMTGDVSLGSEQGLLGLVFSPDGRYGYVNYTDTNGDTHITEFAMRDGIADPSSRRDLLVVDQPFSNHNGGHLAFGPDGHLYIGLGDGGSAGDPNGNGQSLSVLLGKMLRIDPRPSGSDPYGVPADNPFVERPGARPEIWAYGLRNPWRYSFDRLTGDLWIGDVGQGEWEEVDLQPGASAGGENYGWNLMEGTHPYSGAEPPDGAVPPVFEYSHDEGGCVVTGGYVYRGEAIPQLRGAYVFADFCLGQLEALRVRDGDVTDHRVLGPVVSTISSFGEDASGELYALSLSEGIYKLVPGRS